MAWYVNAIGVVYRFNIHGPTTIRLDDGSVLREPLEGESFATEVAADKFAELLRAGHSIEEAKKLHSAWVKDRGYNEK